MFSWWRFLMDWRRECQAQVQAFQAQVQAFQAQALNNQAAILQALASNEDRLARIEQIVTDLQDSLSEAQAVGFRVWAQLDGQPAVELTGESMSLVLTDVQKVTLTIAPVDAKGNPAPVDGAPVWSSSDETIATITPAADGLSAVVVAVGPLGAAQVNVSADADLGEGVVTITGTLDVQVTASAATTLGIATGTPEAQ